MAVRVLVRTERVGRERRRTSHLLHDVRLDPFYTGSHDIHLTRLLFAKQRSYSIHAQLSVVIAARPIND